jgi:hypothetical protein
MMLKNDQPIRLIKRRCTRLRYLKYLISDRPIILQKYNKDWMNNKTERSFSLFNHISNNCHFDNQQLANDMQIYVVTSKNYSRKYQCSKFCFLPEY